MKNILCFGDSLTWGFNAEDRSRFSYEQRWTGILQELLGQEYRIIEEGLNGRTTAFNDVFTPFQEMGTAVNVLPMILETHCPIDLVILMLGTNDLQEHRGVSIKMSARGIVDCLKKIITSCTSPTRNAPKILLVTPPKLNQPEGLMKMIFNEQALDYAQLVEYYGLAASTFSAEFLDITASIQATKIDGIHLDQEGNKALAALLSKKLLSIFEAERTL